jgi:hypothetical protein
MVSIYITCVWCLYISPVYGVYIYHLCMVSIYLNCVWCLYISPVYGVYTYHLCMVSIYITCVWCLYISPVYGVYISQLIHCAKTISAYDLFINWARQMTEKLMLHEFLVSPFKSTLCLKFCGRYYDRTCQYSIPWDLMLSDVFHTNNQVVLGAIIFATDCSVCLIWK